MIVKIQRAQPPLGPKGQVLIYNRSGSYWWQGTPDRRVDDWMGDRQKAYAHVHMDGTVMVVDRAAKWQEW